jgi:hypothetical protein
MGVLVQFALHQFRLRMTAWGQWQVLPRRNIDGRFTSESSRNSDKVALTLSAMSRHMQCSKIS